MSVEHGRVRFVVLAALIGGLVGTGMAVGAAPAAAQEDTVRLKAASGFTAGGRAGSAEMTVVKRTAGCVEVRTALAIGLVGLTADQVLVQVRIDGDTLRTLTVADAGNGLVRSARTAPERSELCRRRSASVRYRVTFLATAPAGEAVLVAEAYAVGAGLIGTGTDTARVSSSRGPATPATSPSLSPTPSPTPTPSTEESVAAVASVPAVGAVTGPGEPSGGFGLAPVVMGFGVLLVGVGAALLVLLIRRGRAERDGDTVVGRDCDTVVGRDGDTVVERPGGLDSTRVLPTIPPG